MDYADTVFSSCVKLQLDRQRGRCPPEWTREVFGMHLNMGIVDGLDRITQPVVSLSLYLPLSASLNPVTISNHIQHRFCRCSSEEVEIKQNHQKKLVNYGKQHYKIQAIQKCNWYMEHLQELLLLIHF